MGAAASAGAGAAPTSIAQGVRRTVQLRYRVRPLPSAHQAYARRYAIHRGARRAVTNV